MKRMILFEQTKSIPITKEMVWEAYLEVKKKGKSAGIDDLSMELYSKCKSRELYKVWNRLSSGSYFPSAVKRVEITKTDGGKRPLGIPTISDRVAQTVIRRLIEPRFEALFHESSYGYRPNKSAHAALEAARTNCWRYNWVLDLDIKGFFDNIDHEKMLKALERHIPERWIMMYIQRWLTVPVRELDGREVARRKGTPQGGVISPLLANIYLHYTLDAWLEKHYPEMKFERYADDVVIHCQSEAEVRALKDNLETRLRSCGLEMHGEKTRIVYCRDSKRRGKYPVVKFDFLGFSFQPRTSKHRKTGELFLGYDCAMSIQSRSRILDTIRKMDIQRTSCNRIVYIAQQLNPYIRGWVHYYGRFRGYELDKVFYVLRTRLMRWAKDRYKRYRNNIRKAYAWLDRVRKQYPNLFYHWQLGYAN
ncbi:MAG: group II intron reverse transcriptase/maturase [Cyclobacteriaceae bacterium]|jgi:RNA-directed DNA polymerase